MKKLGVIALLLSLGMFTVGCEKKKEGAAPAETPPANAGADSGGNGS